MTFFIPKIQLSRLYKNELEVFKMLDKAPYGKELAGKVAHKLTNKNIIRNKLYHSHRDYCGLGLFTEDDKK